MYNLTKFGLLGDFDIEQFYYRTCSIHNVTQQFMLAIAIVVIILVQKKVVVFFVRPKTCYIIESSDIDYEIHSMNSTHL